MYKELKSIQYCSLPEVALPKVYADIGGYTDCYAVDISGSYSHSDFVHAFYTSPVFKLERFILSWMVSKPSSDAQAKQLAEGSIDSFAAWTVECRIKNQLLMCDYQSRTRSWLMVEPWRASGCQMTRLYFATVIVPQRKSLAGKPTIGLLFTAMLGFHKLYARILLHAAKICLFKRYL